MIVLGSCKSGGKGGASAGRTGGAITTGTSDLDYTKVGVSFSKLDRRYQDQINNALKMSEAMQKDIADGRKYKMTDEFIFGKGKTKYKVITDVKDNKAVYTIKQGNKIVKRDLTKSQCANDLANLWLKLNK